MTMIEECSLLGLLVIFASKWKLPNYVGRFVMSLMCDMIVTH